MSVAQLSTNLVSEIFEFVPQTLLEKYAEEYLIPLIKIMNKSFNIIDN